MFTPASSRAAHAYRRFSVESSVEMADPHKLVTLLFEALQRAIGSAKLAMQAGSIPAKCEHIGKAIRIIEEGLKAPLDLEKGGEVAANLDSLYEYCVRRLVLANARNDLATLDEVSNLIEPVANGWEQIAHKGSAGVQHIQ